MDDVQTQAPSDTTLLRNYVGGAWRDDVIMGILATQAPGKGGEIQLTDAIRKLIPGTGVEAFRYRGHRYDCGSKMGYLEATMDMGLAHPEYGPQLRARLQGMLGGAAA